MGIENIPDVLFKSITTISISMGYQKRVLGKDVNKFRASGVIIDISQAIVDDTGRSVFGNILECHTFAFIGRFLPSEQTRIHPDTHAIIRLSHPLFRYGNLPPVIVFVLVGWDVTVFG